MYECASENFPIIYVTGFGPFSFHSENASQKVVEKLALFNIESELNVKLETDILDVAYKSVFENIPNKWKKYKPKLVIHIGVSELAENIVLEKQAFNDDYFKPDVYNCCLQSKNCLLGYPQTMQTELNLEKAIEGLENEDHPHLKCSISSDPGRYLCGFVYYLSLNIDKQRSLFIHVPTLKLVNKNPDEAVYQMAYTIRSLIKILYNQVIDIEKECEESQINEILHNISQQSLLKIML